MTPRAAVRPTPHQAGFTVTPQSLLLVVGLLIPMAGVIGSYFRADARINSVMEKVQAVEQRQALADQRQDAADQRTQDHVNKISQNVLYLCQARARDDQETGRTPRGELGCTR
jgi:hypothetical protein